MRAMAQARTKPPLLAVAAAPPPAAMTDAAPSGPVELIYGSESPVKLADVARHLSSARGGRDEITRVRHLGFWGTRFHDGSRRVFRALGRKLKKHRRRVLVEELVVSGVPGVGNEELGSLAPYLNRTTALRFLDLTGASFDAAALKEVKPFFRRNSSLEVLVLGENQCLGDEGVKAALGGLQAGKGRLRVLAVDSCGVGPRGAASISRFMMRGGRSLRALELSNNDIGDGVETLVRALRHGHRLGHLALNNAGIADQGATALGEVLTTNRTLHTLSLKNNGGITNVGASALLKAVFNTDSIKTIIGSNHVLQNLTLGGCVNVGRDLLKLSSQLSAHSRLLSDAGDVIRHKVETYLKEAEGGLALEEFDLELMPHILAFVGKSNGMTSLFHTLKSMPLLYTQYAPQEGKASKEDGGEKEKKKEATANKLPFLEQLRLSSRRARKHYAIFANTVPKRSGMLRYQDRRIRNKHESASASASNNSVSSSFAQPLRSTSRSVVERAILLWLFHTRRVCVSTCILLKLIPRAFMFLFLCPQA